LPISAIVLSSVSPRNLKGEALLLERARISAPGGNLKAAGEEPPSGGHAPIGDVGRGRLWNKKGLRRPGKAGAWADGASLIRAFPALPPAAKGL